MLKSCAHFPNLWATPHRVTISGLLWDYQRLHSCISTKPSATKPCGLWLAFPSLIHFRFFLSNVTWSVSSPLLQDFFTQKSMYLKMEQLSEKKNCLRLMGVHSTRARIKKIIIFKAKQMLLLCLHRRHLGFDFFLRFFFFSFLWNIHECDRFSHLIRNGSEIM